MKKKSLKKLELKKQSISKLDQQELTGQGFTAGCTDGCGTLQTALMCTFADCTADCTYGITILCSLAVC